MNKLLILTSCLLLILLNQPTTAYGAAESGVAGISLTLDKTTMPDYMWTTARVNLRTEASTNSDIITTVEKRIKVETLKKTSSSEWVKVKYDNKVGYIHKNYLRDVELPSLDFTDDEIKMLQRITEAECTGQSIESKENVVSAIINRVLSCEFPDDVESVIFESGQFSPISDKRYYSVIVTEDTIKAVDNVLSDGVEHNGLFFCNITDIKSLSKKDWFKGLKYLFKDDSGHSYYN